MQLKSKINDYHRDSKTLWQLATILYQKPSSCTSNPATF